MEDLISGEMGGAGPGITGKVRRHQLRVKNRLKGTCGRWESLWITETNNDALM